MIALRWDLEQFASNGVALLLTLVLALCFFYQTASRREVTAPPATASESNIEVALQQDLPAAPVIVSANSPPQPPQEHLRHLSAHRAMAAPSAPSEQMMATAPELPLAGGAVEAAASPPPSALPSAAPRPDLDAQYAAGLRADIDRRTRPPDSAQYRLHRPSGEVRVGFVLVRSGEPKSVRVLHSSGSALLDDAAVSIVAMGHYPPMTADLFGGEAQHTFSVTIEFRRTG